MFICLAEPCPLVAMESLESIPIETIYLPIRALTLCILGLAGLLILSPTSIAAQSTPSNIQRPFAIVRDQKAQDLILRSLKPSGVNWGQVNDFQVAGSASRWSGIDETTKVTISGNAKGERRIEIGSSSGSRYVEFQSGGFARYSKGSDGPKSVPVQSALSEAIYFPLPYLTSILADTQIELVYKGISIVEGRELEGLEATRIFPSAESSPSTLNQFTKRTLYFDPETGLLVRISYRAYSSKNALVGLQRCIDYDDYEVDQGVTFPHLVKQYQGLALLDSLTITGIALNAGLPSQLFQSTN